jgi:hypothetical protein
VVGRYDVATPGSITLIVLAPAYAPVVPTVSESEAVPDHICTVDAVPDAPMDNWLAVAVELRATLVVPFVLAMLSEPEVPDAPSVSVPPLYVNGVAPVTAVEPE